MRKQFPISSLRKKKQIIPPNQKAGKTPILLDHHTRLEQKLSKLRQEVSEKRKVSVSNQKSIQNCQVSEQLIIFLQELSFSQYAENFRQNGIDSMDVLKEVKQKELQQIGIAKGHALKIMVNLKKREKNSQETRPNTKSQEVSSNHSQRKKKDDAPLQIIVQTEEEQQKVHRKRYFCLFCYKRAEQEFCDQSCLENYNSMFSVYENNLAKAQQMFLKPKKDELPENSEEFIEDLNFLQEEQDESFDRKAYNEALNDLNDI